MPRSRSSQRQSPVDLRERHLAATTAFADAVEVLERRALVGPHRPPARRTCRPAVTAAPTRRREVEIYDADLGTSYTRADLPRDFVAELLDTVGVDDTASGPFQLRATDLGRDWSVGGDGGPTVMGAGADLGWWLTGRGDGEGLSARAASLPSLAPWRRAAAGPPA